MLESFTIEGIYRLVYLISIENMYRKLSMNTFLSSSFCNLSLEMYVQKVLTAITQCCMWFWKDLVS